MSEKILITSALLYANGSLHPGHIAGAYLPADCYARYQRLQKKDVLYVSGSDEYGFAITLNAELAKKSPQEYVDHFHNQNLKLFEKLDFSFDNYSRTTWKGHKKIVQEFFLDLLKNGYIEEKVENHLFSEKENKFLADRYVLGTCPKCGYENARGDECTKCGATYDSNDLKNPKSKVSLTPLTLKPTKHWYLRFDKFKEKLVSWLDNKNNWKQNVLNFILPYIKDLKPRSITRDSNWGVPLPIENAEGKVLYVWFDAPIGYISACMEWAEKIGDPEKWKDYWLDPKTKLVHFIGKDNIPFHTIFFPAMIMGQNKPYKLADDVPANEFLMLEGKQFSKSENWYIDIDKFLKKYTVDEFRYYLMANAPENSDADFSYKDFQMRVNSELVGKFGNFIHRTLTFAKNKCFGKQPKVHDLDQIDKKFLNQMTVLVNEISCAYENFHLRKVTQLIMELSQLGNVYFDAKKPWVSSKSEATFQNMYNTIGLSIECIKRLALVSCPVIPKTSQTIWNLIGFNDELAKQEWNEINRSEIIADQILQEPKILFKKIEDEEIEKDIMSLKEENNFKDQIKYDDFAKLDMRVGQILKVEKVEKSERLLLLEVDIGTEKRQIVSGLAKAFSIEDLLGKKVIVLVNLKPTKIMGIESQGMIIAGGESDDDVELPFFSDLSPGAEVS